MQSTRRLMLFFREKGDLQLKPTTQEAAKKLKGELASVFKGEYVAAYMDVQYYLLKNLAQILDKAHAKETDEDEDLKLVANDAKPAPKKTPRKRL
ncbi:hypothetical protein PR003_g23475 [Phytophthora rubi]|uniref:Uncharacterized protein n=1 Tax=Phytophthora rubi TaxID=129364 RepID=A0A6A3J4T8_9STRA|nr:hypothetical protein PR002_g22633 [Phytophthora rubi]KAE8987415.1 hypothetical protein PR001_g22332 [Phytophthora rubi]KAE9297522.1 hypothetical protein PR003_g23475 [Phytophthora rubi]